MDTIILCPACGHQNDLDATYCVGCRTRLERGKRVTNEQAQDAVGTILIDSSTIDFTYDDAANTITAATIDNAIDHNDLFNFVAGEHFLQSAISITASQVSDFSEAVDDRTDGLLVAGTNITLTYDDGANTLTIDASGGASEWTDT
ncbi:MAG: zinc ribbon domain-containing protein, partial [Chloroflexi bacterium]|nr:zinc ribbon domain-containing protein [Chloroflexota bacterium]